MTVYYPDNLVFSGDLNRLSIIKNTTATHVEISFIIDGYTYNENLYFLTSDITFSMSKILNLLFTRSYNNNFDTVKDFFFTVKLYNNTSLLDTFNLSIETVILGGRRVFDKLGVVKNIEEFDFNAEIGLLSIGYYFEYPSDVFAVHESSAEFIDRVEGLTHLGLADISGGYTYWLSWTVYNFMLNSGFAYMSGSNFWTSSTFAGCSTTFGITVANKLQFICPDVSCGDTLTIQYNGRTFVEGQLYSITINIDTINNPSGNPMYLKAEIGGVQSIAMTTTGVQTVFITAGAGGVLKLIAYMDADTSGFGTHSFSATSIVVTDLIEHRINLNQDCDGSGAKIAIKFLNRFGFWRGYHVYLKSENINSINGIKLPFLEYNYTELNNTFAEINKGETQSINVFRENLSKEIANDFSDIISSNHVHLYDEVNSVWIPIKVQTNTFNMIEKENLFDVNLNLLLQVGNE